MNDAAETRKNRLGETNANESINNFRIHRSFACND